MVIAIVKGLALGIAMFFVFSVIYLYAWGMISTKGAVGVEAFKAVVTHNPLYWTAGALIVALGCVIMLIWPVRVSP